MDPYDDYDPAQYFYDESDGEGDIVYLEGPIAAEISGTDPFLPQDADLLSPQHSQVHGTAAEHHPTATNSGGVNLLPRRERKRRRRLVAARLENEHDDSSSYASSEESGQRHEEAPRGHQGEDDDEEQESGAFALLQSLLFSGKENHGAEEQDDPCSQEKHETNAAIPSAAPASVELRAAAPPVQAGLDSSQARFGLPDDDAKNDTRQEHLVDESDGIIAAEHSNHDLSIYQNSRPRKSLPIASHSLERELKRQRVQRTTMNNGAQTNAVFQEQGMPQNARLLSELERTRKLAKGKDSRRRPKPKGNRDRRMQSQGSTSLPLTATEEAHSIVGSRPMHWGGGLSTSQSSGFASQGKSRRLERQKATTKASGKLLSWSHQTVRSTPKLPMPLKSKLFHLQREMARPRDAPPRRPEQTTRNLSFAPSFMSCSTDRTQDATKGVTTADDVQDCTQPTELEKIQQTPLHRRLFPNSLQVTNAVGPSSSGSTPNSNPRRYRTKRIKAGPLMQRLRSIRGLIQGDKIRFQSGIYPFPESGVLDRNDPRRRASHYMDITVVGDLIPWTAQHGHVTALSFVHKYHTRSDSVQESTGGELGGFYAWLCFSFDTASAQKLQVGAQLRIYNAVRVRMATEDDSHENDDDAIALDTIVCTQLCEPYPASLPPLTTPPRFSPE